MKPEQLYLSAHLPKLATTVFTAGLAILLQRLVQLHGTAFALKSAMTHFRYFVVAALALAVSVACKNENGTAISPKAVEPAPKVAEETPKEVVQPPLLPKLERTRPLTEAARRILEEPMRRHSADMQRLLWSGIMLDYQSLETTATRLADEPRVSRPMDMKDGVFAASFPPEYIAKEDLLYESARALAEGAKAKDMKAVSAAYIKMAGTCIGCHNIYLTMPDAK